MCKFFGTKKYPRLPILASGNAIFLRFSLVRLHIFWDYDIIPINRGGRVGALSKTVSQGRREVLAMKVTLNPDAEIVKTVREGLKQTGGYCPCRRERTEENKCMCREFREQMKDPSFEGFCHCMLYYKSLD